MLVVDSRGRLVERRLGGDTPVSADIEAAWRAGVEAEAEARKEGMSRDALEVRATLEAFAQQRDESQEEIVLTLYGIFGGRSMVKKLWRVFTWELDIKRSMWASKRRIRRRARG